MIVNVMKDTMSTIYSIVEMMSIQCDEHGNWWQMIERIPVSMQIANLRYN